MADRWRGWRPIRALLAGATLAVVAPQTWGGLPNDSCSSCTVIANLPFSDEADNSGAAPGPPAASCNTGSATVMQNDAWWCYTATNDCLLLLHVDYSPIDGQGYDGMTAVYAGSCGTLTELACLNSTFGGADADMLELPATAGTTYYFQVGDWGSTGTGGATIFELDCRPPDDERACCFPDGGCTEVTALSCVEAGGASMGEGSDCSPNPCPQPPANDECTNAIEIAVGSGMVVETCLAADDFTPECDVTTPNQGVWFEVVGTGNLLVASTCYETTNFDTKLQVFCNGCDEPICVVGDDDPFGALPDCVKDGENRKALAEWCSIEGVTYTIVVGGFGTDCGTVELTVIEEEACEDPVICEPQAARCCLSDCPPDITGDRQVNVDDLVSVILGWGPCDGSPCVGDIDGNGEIDVDDLVAVVLAWGPCEPTCVDVLESLCAELGGAWNGNTSCAQTPCPTAPTNDTCPGATIETLPFFTQVDTTLALSSIPAGSCNVAGATVMQSDVWWSYTAESSCLLRVSVDASFDAIVVISTGATCDVTELACLDEPDSPGGVVVAVDEGQTYFVQLGARGTEPGGGVATLELQCLPPGTGACCLPFGSCVLISETLCAEQGGMFQGDTVTCADVSCTP